MLAFQIIYVWGPQIIGFACSLLIVIFMLKTWRKTGNTGFLMLAIIAALGEVYFLVLKFGIGLFPGMSLIDHVTSSAWFSLLFRLAAVAAWWLLYKQLTAKEVIHDRGDST